MKARSHSHAPTSGHSCDPPIDSRGTNRFNDTHPSIDNSATDNRHTAHDDDAGVIGPGASSSPDVEAEEGNDEGRRHQQ